MRRGRLLRLSCCRSGSVRLEMNANSGCDIDAQVNDGRSYTLTRSTSSFTLHSLAKLGIPASHERLWLERYTRHKVRPHFSDFDALILYSTEDHDREEHEDTSSMPQQSYDISNHKYEAMRSV